jgi:hypothetical protein
MLSETRRLGVGILAVCVCLSTAPRAQWLDYRSSATPRLPDGRPNLNAPTPRTPDGKPDLSGIWDVVGDRVMPTDGRVRSKYVYDIASDLPGGAPFLPWAKALHAERQRALGVGAPTEQCLPHGIPDAMLTRTLPFKIVQTPGVTIILFEEFNNWRQVFTDGRPLPTDPQPAWLGYSVGAWEGDTFVITTTGFNDKSWLDAGGTPHTEALRTTERLTRTAFGHMEITFTFDDPKTFTKPLTVRVNQRLMVDQEMIEFICNENERSTEHIPKPGLPGLPGSAPPAPPAK